MVVKNIQKGRAARPAVPAVPAAPKSKPAASKTFVMAPKSVAQLREMKEQFSDFGVIVFLRTYARKKDDGSIESWCDVVIRVITGTFHFKKQQSKRWNEAGEQRLALAMAKAMFNLQWLPPGRGLWAMAKDYVERFGNMALNNCGFVSTEESKFGNMSLAVAIKWMMDASMLGVGIGFDTDWKGTVYLPNPDKIERYIIPDTREGWSQSTYLLLQSYLMPNMKKMVFDYSRIRAAGEPIKGFGGIAAGPGVLVLAHRRIAACLETYYRCQNGMGAKESIRQMIVEAVEYEDNNYVGKLEALLKAYDAVPADQKTYLNARLIVDLFNIVGVCVVSGNVRRSAEIALGDPNDEEFLALKDFIRNPERDLYGWMSNNSVRIENEAQYDDIAKNIVHRIIQNGEPGILNLVTANQVDPKNPKKKKDKGVNPCGEITLESFELCCLSEVFPSNCFVNGVFDLPTYLAACRYAAIYASVVSCIPSYNEYTDEVVSHNHRVGVSQSGLFHMYDVLNRGEYHTMLKEAFKTIKAVCNRYIFSVTFVEPIAVTTVKPSGTISILANSLCGVHPMIENRFVMRRITVGASLPIADALKRANVPYEPNKNGTDSLMFEFPLDQGLSRPAKDVSMWEQCMMMIEVQRLYSDNAVSVSLYFERVTEIEQLPFLIRYILPHIKSISFMPRQLARKLTLKTGHEIIIDVDVPEDENTRFIDDMINASFVTDDEKKRFANTKPFVYEQAMFVSISEDEYKKRRAAIGDISSVSLTVSKTLTESDGASTKYCDGLACSI